MPSPFKKFIENFLLFAKIYFWVELPFIFLFGGLIVGGHLTLAMIDYKDVILYNLDIAQANSEIAAHNAHLINPYLASGLKCEYSESRLPEALSSYKPDFVDKFGFSLLKLCFLGSMLLFFFSYRKKELDTRWYLMLCFFAFCFSFLMLINVGYDYLAPYLYVHNNFLNLFCHAVWV